MTESDRITQLDDATIRKIAAGEVVERPASVVKELVENSLDADADRIDVTVESGGTERIEVSDDGIGMRETDLRTAVEEHTTSKIEDIEDLESGVTTLGFRGEALHTIGAVSRTTITSKPRDGDERGTELRMEGGEVESVSPAGRPAGTTVEVADLFYNTPARRKYLKTTATEFSHVNTVVTRYALANPDVAVSLTHDDREVFATTGRGDLQSALLSVYGREVATAMISVGDEAEHVAVSGYVSDPETTRSTREYVSTYVNGRYVSSSVLRDAILSAYGGQLAADRFPFAVLFVEVPPSEVDVNVHPRKLECRWEDEAAVKAAVEDAVESALLDHGLVRSSAPRGRSAPEEARIEPAGEGGATEGGQTDESDQARLGTDAEGDLGEREQATLDAEPAAGRSNSELDERGESERSGASGSAPEFESASGRSDATAGSTGDAADSGFESGTSAESGSRTDFAPDSSASDPGAASGSEVDQPTSAPTDADPDGTASKPAAESTEPAASTARDPERKFTAATEPGTLSGATAETPAFESLPEIRVLGQLRDTYVVAETPDGLVLIDQHAADERINYERLAAEFADDATTQMLAEPVALELTAREAALFGEYREPLETLGFRAERTGDREVTVRTAPTVLDETLDPELLRDALGEFVSTDPDERGDTVEAVADDLLADLACYPSITGNTSLREGSVVELLAALDDCENPYACPHGRPVIVEFSAAEIEDRFERDYPGHGGRRGDD
ncbi:DNA mismatch repair protein MutL [Halobacteriales archaeon QS_1_67_19]|nr:MAG: DNA mismatch repair protein MutL [Halobacteriales archaeon QS_1_67_19]